MIFGAFGGTLIADLLGRILMQAIAESVKRTNPHDPLDGLPFIFFGFVFLGFVLGTTSGLLAAAVVYFTNRQHKHL